MEATTKLKRKRSIEEAPSYAIGHLIRIEILGILNETTRCPSELARIIHQPLTTVGHHINELLASGCIELVRVEKVRNTAQHFYRAVELPFITDEESANLPEQVRQEFSALILQAIMAEALGSLWAGKMQADPRVRMLWRWFHLDKQGRQDFADELRESWERLSKIEVDSFNRISETGEKPVTMIAALMGFERSRPVGTTAPAEQRAAAEGKS